MEVLLSDETDNISESIEVNTRIVQNLKEVDFGNDSDEDVEWTPNKDDEELLIETEEIPNERTLTKEVHSCNKCDFITKYEYSLTRQVENHNVKRKQTSSLEYDVPTKRTKVDKLALPAVSVHLNQLR